jgi:hypothetical protein
VRSILYELRKPGIGFDLERVLVGEQRRGILQYQAECADLRGSSIKHLWAVDYQKQTKNVYGKRPNQPQRQSATGTRRLSSSAAPRSPSPPPRSGPSPPRQTRPVKLHCAITVAGLVRARRTKLSDGGITEEGLRLEEGVAGGGDGSQEVGGRLLLLLPQQLLGPGCTTAPTSRKGVRVAAVTDKLKRRGD